MCPERNTDEAESMEGPSIQYHCQVQQSNPFCTTNKAGHQENQWLEKIRKRCQGSILLALNVLRHQLPDADKRGSNGDLRA